MAIKQKLLTLLSSMLLRAVFFIYLILLYVRCVIFGDTGIVNDPTIRDINVGKYLFKNIFFRNQIVGKCQSQYTNEL